VFKERIKTDQSVRVTRAESSGGGGAVGFAILALVAFAVSRPAKSNA
jgi:hypothetical protein